MKRFFAILAVALCATVVFSSCKDDEDVIKYDEVLLGKWMVEDVNPPMESAYLEKGTTVEFKSNYTFELGSQWSGMFKATSWLTATERDSKLPYLLMLASDAEDITHEVMKGSINLSGTDTIYLDYEDPYMPSATYTFKLVRQK